MMSTHDDADPGLPIIEDQAPGPELIMNMSGRRRLSVGAGIAYMVASTTSLLHPLLPKGTAAGTTWDSKGINFWKNNFSASNVRVDTYVPLPAAIVLLGSALATFFGIRRRQMATQG